MTVGEGALSLKRNALYNSIGSLTYLLCQWLVNVLVVRLGSYADGGMLTLAISVTNVFFVVATFSLRVYQASDVTGRFSASRYLSTRVMTSLLGLSLCVLFTLLWAQIAARFANRSTPAVLNRATGGVLVVLGVVILGVNYLT